MRAWTLDLSVILGRHLFQSLIGFRGDKKDIAGETRKGEGEEHSLAWEVIELTSLE